MYVQESCMFNHRFSFLFLGIFIEMKTNRDFLAMHLRDELFHLSLSLFLSHFAAWYFLWSLHRIDRGMELIKNKRTTKVWKGLLGPTEPV